MNPALQKLPAWTPYPRRTPTRRYEPEEPTEPEVALRVTPDGVEQIPLTLDILLNPSLDVQVPQSDEQFKEIHSLTDRLKTFVERRQGWRLFSDVIIQWPGAPRNPSPDISVAENVLPDDPEEPRMSLDVAREGCRVRAVIEVVSRGKIQREKDEKKNPPLFAKAGVDDLVLLYPPRLRGKDDPPLRVKRLVGGTYREQKPDAKGRYLLRSIGVRLSVSRPGKADEKLILHDAETGEELMPREEVETKLQETEASREEEAAKRRDAEAKHKAEAAKRRKAERRAEAESTARQAESTARQAAERRTAELLVTVLEQRGLELDAHARQRILGCQDPGQLDRWMRHAFTVDTVDDLFRT